MQAGSCRIRSQNDLHISALRRAGVTPRSSHSYVYDAENRINSASGFTYVYDTDGNRVQKINGNTAPVAGTLYWYMTAGIVAESDLVDNLQSEYVFFDGERVAPYADFSHPQSLNIYGYVGNNPVSRADKDGHCWHWLWGGSCKEDPPPAPKPPVVITPGTPQNNLPNAQDAARAYPNL